MSARTLVPVAMVSALLMTTAAFAQTAAQSGRDGTKQSKRTSGRRRSTEHDRQRHEFAKSHRAQCEHQPWHRSEIRSQQSQRFKQPQQSGNATIAAATAPELKAALDVVMRALGRSASSG